MNCPYNKERKIILPDESFIGGSQTVMKLKDILITLNRSFCGSIGIEFMNHTSVDIRQWVKRKFEEPAFVSSMHSPHIKQLILLRLIRAHSFEQFVSSKWPNEKQHGAVGCEILMPALETLIDFGSAHGAQSFVLGMTTTRARLNVLANVFRKPLQQIFVPFHHQTSEGVLLHDDDKYILGNNVKKVTSNQALPTEFAVLASTSNFVEAIDPLVSGKTMAEQLYTADDDGRRVWPIVIHGDEVISGQGIVMETLRMANQKGFSTNGTIHIVLTNQSNLPRNDSPKSDAGSIYTTNVAHTTMAPVFHVNSQDPEAVVYCMKVAAEYRAKFKSDVIVDLICYQKYLPPDKSIPKEIAKKIDSERPILEKYSEKMVKEELSTWYEIDNSIQKYNHLLEYSYSKAQKSSFKVNEWIDSPWKRFFEKKLQLVDPNTSLIPSVYKVTVENIISYRPDINTHPSVLDDLSTHFRMAKENKITWLMAENLAIAFMLQEGINVRMTGNNCEEGESIRRYHARYAVDTPESRIPLRGMYKAQGYYTVCNSLSSEFANLGFEIGFSQTSPKSLVIWESTKEDRTSLAQYMIDVFLAAGEGRWFRQTGIVCLIPHGMEGKGDSTSTGRPERFLQMCNDDYQNPITEMPLQLVKCNWIVANVTTPSNYFHILRRQMKVNFRKPLILFTHKKLFKKMIYSPRENFLNKNRFQVYFPDYKFPPNSDLAQGVKKVLFCTGKVYYELLDARDEANLKKEIAICRVEQISPFPFLAISKDIVNYPNASFHWVQEEHRNQGWWTYVRPRFIAAMEMIKKKDPKTSIEPGINYIGRGSAYQTATEIRYQHFLERSLFLADAMKIM
ncbi:2-oxoglutarate dehydrogenase-like, mitochondrial isoform X2 [Halyomorpha halys]|nr:2-oxoglutarate dehydrogenase-like, mitochondrial isoform X2 [Halyomorpha halys]